jgi:hypothetical protein
MCPELDGVLCALARLGLDEATAETKWASEIDARLCSEQGSESDVALIGTEVLDSGVGEVPHISTFSDRSDRSIAASAHCRE